MLAPPARGVVLTLVCLALQACAGGGAAGDLGFARRIPPLSGGKPFPPRSLLILTSLRLRGGTESSSTDEERVWRPEPKPWDREVARAAINAAIDADSDRDCLASSETSLSETHADDVVQQQQQQQQDLDPGEEREARGTSELTAEGQSCAQQARADGADEDVGFPAITAEDGHALNVGSLCFKCRKQGMTRILPSTIPW